MSSRDFWLAARIQNSWYIVNMILTEVRSCHAFIDKCYKNYPLYSCFGTWLTKYMNAYLWESHYQLVSQKITAIVKYPKLFPMVIACFYLLTLTLMRAEHIPLSCTKDSIWLWVILVQSAAEAGSMTDSKSNRSPTPFRTWKANTSRS